jgi:hypothetical protein
VVGLRPADRRTRWVYATEQEVDDGPMYSVQALGGDQPEPVNLPEECGGGLPEPGTLAAGDLTGDGAEELIVIALGRVHGGMERTTCVYAYEHRDGGFQLIFETEGSFRAPERYGGFQLQVIRVTGPGRIIQEEDRNGELGINGPVEWRYDPSKRIFVAGPGK